MSTLSGIFKDPSPGTLMVYLSGRFFVTTYHGDIHYGPPGDITNLGYIRVKATIGGVDVPSIDNYNPTSSLQLDYPGGNAEWAFGTSIVPDVSVTPYLGGPGWAQWGFHQLELVMTLFKK